MNVKIDVSDIYISRGSLVIRPYKWEDLGDFYENTPVDGSSDEAHYRNYECIDDASEVLHNFIVGKNVLAIEFDGKVIGSIGLVKYNENLANELSNLRGVEVGCSLSKNYWNRGIMTEVLGVVVNYLFTRHSLDFVIYCHYLDNIRSQRVREKNGFTDFKIYDKDCFGETRKSVISIKYR